jgi:UDP-2,4-diacetamido-2,4,6-trideoxy-beta-L-altropyranose hydrolase
MNLLFRTDASVTMGTGHVMRCLALAQAWQDAGGSAMFAMTECTAAIEVRLAAEFCDVLFVSSRAGTQDDLRETSALARKHKAQWIVVDGYQFNTDYQRALKEAGFKILFLDDYGHARHYFADLVLNQNVSASESLYQLKEAQTRLLLGPRYSLLRREFAPWRDWKREISPVGDRVLVIMGGSDAENLTARAIEGLRLAGLELQTTVIVGGSNPHLETLQGATAQTGQKITLRRDVANIAELMARADVAISAAGSTCWELCLLGLPALLIDVAENQTAIARELHLRACAVHVGNQTVSAGTIGYQLRLVLQSYEFRRSLSNQCRELVDGLGARRVVSVLQGERDLRFRRARAEDRRLLWEWANDPKVRAASFSSTLIPWETHVDWFAQKLASDKSLLLIAEDEQAVPFGQIRFDFRQRGEADLNISLTAEKQGCGLAVPVIQAGIRELFANSNCSRVHAFVKLENVPSSKAFERAGFVRIGIEQVGESAAAHFIFRRD